MTPSLFKSLTRASIASLLATGVEFMILPVLVHLIKLPHWVSYVVVQFIANAISFTLYKYWAFEAGSHGRVGHQYIRQLCIFGGSLVFNTAIASFCSYHLHIEPVLSFAISNVIVYLGWNYPGNRYWVFKRESQKGPTAPMRPSKDPRQAERTAFVDPSASDPKARTS